MRGSTHLPASKGDRIVRLAISLKVTVTLERGDAARTAGDDHDIARFDHRVGGLYRPRDAAQRAPLSVGSQRDLDFAATGEQFVGDQRGQRCRIAIGAFEASLPSSFFSRNTAA